MKIEGYEVTEIAPGVKSYERKNAPYPTYEHAHPWVHFHYPQTDDEAERLGYMESELCCHGCGIALWVTFPFPLTQESRDRALAIRAEFNSNHGEHDDIYIEGNSGILASLTKVLKGHPLTQLCPDYRKQVFAIDLRG